MALIGLSQPPEFFDDFNGLSWPHMVITAYAGLHRSAEPTETSMGRCGLKALLMRYGLRLRLAKVSGGLSRLHCKLAFTS